MKLTNAQSDIRRYLLGTLPEGEMPPIEERILTDDSFLEELHVSEDELIDDYLRGALAEDESERFRDHFLSTPERHEKLRFAGALRKYASAHAAAATPASPKRSWLRSLSASPLVPALSLLVVLALGVGAWRVFFHQSDVSRGLVALKTAYAASPTEARVTVFDSAPPRQTRGTSASSVNEDAHRMATRYLIAAVQDERDAESHHALGCLYLAERKYDDAIKEFGEALKLDPRSAQTHSDLGAAYLERAKAEQESEPDSGKSTADFGRSADEIDQALALNPSLLGALYNRALCHQYLLMPHQAEEDWRAYLQKDSTSPWADEARHYLSALEEKDQRTSLGQGSPVEKFLAAFRAGDDEAAWKIYTRNHASSGNAVTGALLDAILKDDASGEESLRALAHLGGLERQRTGDTYTSDLARVYASATPPRRAQLAQARALIVEGYQLFPKSKLGDAMERFARAGEAFNAAGDGAEAIFADYSIAYAAAVEPDVEKGRAVLARVVPTCEAKNYTWLLAQSMGKRAQLLLNLNHYSEALTDAGQSLRLSEAAQDAGSTLGSLVQIATTHLYLNDTEKSLSYLRRALVLARSGGLVPSASWASYMATSLNFNALHLDRAALDYQREALRLALDMKKPLYISRSYEYLGQTYGNLKLYDEAVENFRRAYQEGESISQERNGQNMMANVSLKLGDLYRLTADEPRAVAAYDESIRLYDQLNFQHYAYAAHKGKFLAYLATHDDGLAAQELSIILPLFEAYRGQIVEERRRNIFFDREQDVYDLAIDFAGSRLDSPQLAFGYVEWSRARGLLGLMRGGGQVLEDGGETDLQTLYAAPPTASEINDALADDAQLLQYAALKDKLLIFLVTKSDTKMFTVQIGSEALRGAVEGSRDKWASDGESDAVAARTSLSSLYDVLIKPVEDQLDRGKPLVIVPDKALSYVPFAALLSAKTNKYLVEDYRLTFSPSAAVFIESTKFAAARGASPDERLLAVGNPSFDSRNYPRLARLTDAEREANAVAGYYTGTYTAPRILLGEQATASAVRDELECADVAHFAAHYVIDPGSSLRSKLLLAKEAGGESHHVGDGGGGLEPRDIYQMNLSLTRLVVLSACQTGIEQQYGGEGAIGFARPFLAKGVPVVVASLWPVNSNATADLMIDFHRLRREQKLPTAEALRQAQLKMITGDDPRLRRPYYWASFMTIGGRTDF
jgi:CHAT domain-containing protein/tetratricopeptide (TPR) repeat protein